MTDSEIITCMSKPCSGTRVPQYRIIYQLASGKIWNKCFCGNGLQTIYNVCKNYANNLAKKIAAEEAAKTVTE